MAHQKMKTQQSKKKTCSNLAKLFGRLQAMEGDGAKMVELRRKIKKAAARGNSIPAAKERKAAFFETLGCGVSLCFSIALRQLLALALGLFHRP